MSDFKDDKCIFCTIATGNDPSTTLLVDNETVVAFADIKPVAEHHYLVIPKKNNPHISNVKQLSSNDIDLVNYMKDQGVQLLESKGVDIEQALFGFHWPPFNTVNHLHLHCIAPASDMSFLHRVAFKPGTLWFANVHQTNDWLEKHRASSINS